MSSFEKAGCVTAKCIRITFVRIGFSNAALAQYCQIAKKARMVGQGLYGKGQVGGMKKGGKEYREREREREGEKGGGDRSLY